MTSQASSKHAAFCCSWYKNGYWHLVSNLVKHLGVRTDNVFSRSAQCTDTANKAKWLICKIKYSFQLFSKWVTILLYGAEVHSSLEYGVPACSPNLTFPTKRAWSSGDFNPGRRADLIITFKIVTDLSGVDSNLFFSSKGTPTRYSR